MENETFINNSSTTIELNPLKEVFYLFCATDAFRPVMLNPFIVGNKTYATDAYTLVRCDNSKIEFSFINNEKPLNVEGVMPSLNISEIINIDNIDWASFMTLEETIGDGVDIVCGNCKGEGDCDGSDFYKGKHYEYEYECPVCHGSGFEVEENQIPTGNKTFRSNDVVRFKNVDFYAKRFYKLKKVKDLIGGDIELISYNEDRKGVMFRIGIVEILLMPCVNNDDEHVIVRIN